MAELISELFAAWEAQCEKRLARLRENEAEINRIAAEAYGLTGTVSIVPEDRKLSVRRADPARDLRSLLSYAVGCMFGRYAPDAEGLIYAGGEWDISRYRSYIPAENGVIFVTEDDIMKRLRDFLSCVYGAETLSENIRYIEECIGTDCLRYFRSEFFRDHFTVYRKRPIYWLVSSGRRGALRALVYMHRFGSTELELIMQETDRLLGTEKRSGHISELEQLRGRLTELISSGTKAVPDDGVAVNYAKFSGILAKAAL